MATTDDWRQPLSGWLQHFRDWAGLPDPTAVLRVSIFFDLRAVFGEPHLVARIRQQMAECGSGRGKSVFVAALARQAAGYDVPLGFFRRFVLASRGEHGDVLELKARGLLPLTDLVRVRAIAAGITAPGTQARIAQLLAEERLSRSDADRLAGAHRLLAGLRVRLHRSRCVAANSRTITSTPVFPIPVQCHPHRRPVGHHRRRRIGRPAGRGR